MDKARASPRTQTCKTNSSKLFEICGLPFYGARKSVARDMSKCDGDPHFNGGAVARMSGKSGPPPEVLLRHVEPQDPTVMMANSGGKEIKSAGK